MAQDTQSSARPSQYQAQAGAAQSTGADHKAATDDRPKRIEFDAEETSRLLLILRETTGSQAFISINQAAVINLAGIAFDIQKQLENRIKSMTAVAAPSPPPSTTQSRSSSA